MQVMLALAILSKVRFWTVFVGSFGWTGFSDMNVKRMSNVDFYSVILFILYTVINLYYTLCSTIILYISSIILLLI